MQATIFFVDTFTRKAFTGNPTTVCCCNDRLDKETMQSIAAELNMPVTAFLFKREGQPGHYDIQYFTPITEIPACGHATLASAKVMMQLDALDKLTFHTGQGLAINAFEEEGAILMSYPRYGWKNAELSNETLQSLGIDTYQSAILSPELETLFIELNSPQILQDIKPDFKRLTGSSDTIKEVVITTTGGSLFAADYALRSFCPWIGIDEDPVTGSVHSVLGPFWQQRLNKSSFTAFQASARGGALLIKAYGNRVDIGGHSLVIMKGEMAL